MFKSILPKSATGRLYLGCFAIGAAIGTTISVATIAMNALLYRKA